MLGRKKNWTNACLFSWPDASCISSCRRSADLKYGQWVCWGQARTKHKTTAVSTFTLLRDPKGRFYAYRIPARDPYQRDRTVVQQIAPSPYSYSMTGSTLSSGYCLSGVSCAYGVPSRFSWSSFSVLEEFLRPELLKNHWKWKRS